MSISPPIHSPPPARAARQKTCPPIAIAPSGPPPIKDLSLSPGRRRSQIANKEPVPLLESSTKDLSLYWGGVSRRICCQETSLVMGWLQNPQPNPSMNPHLALWNISSEAFPKNGFASDRIEFLLQYAILAPSPLNSQPWLFRLHYNDVEILADRRRQLPISDPDGRELHLACGAAALNFCIAAEYFGQSFSTQLLPNPGDPNLLARIVLGPPTETSSEDVLLFHALTERRTNRQPFRDEAPPEEALEDLADAAAREGAWLALVEDPGQREQLAELIAAADRVRWADHRFRREVASWIRPQSGNPSDGISSDQLGIHSWASFAEGPLIRCLNRGSSQAAHDADLAAHSPALAVLGTDRDEPLNWLQAGQALERALLHGQVQGLSISFLNQAIECPDLRAQVGSIVGREKYPQALLRIGYAHPVPPTPRRAVRSVVLRQESDASR